MPAPGADDSQSSAPNPIAAQAAGRRLTRMRRTYGPGPRLAGVVDPDLARLLTTVVTVLGSLGSAYLGAWIARGGARDVAQITLKNQLELERQKVLREHRRMQVQRYRDIVNRRMSIYSDILAVLSATYVTSAPPVSQEALNAALKRLNEDNLGADFSHWEVEDRGFMQASLVFIEAESACHFAVYQFLKDRDALKAWSALSGAMPKLIPAAVLVNKAYTEYVFGSTDESKPPVAPSRKRVRLWPLRRPNKQRGDADV